MSRKSWYDGSEYEGLYLDYKRGRVVYGLEEHVSRNGNLLNQEDEDLLNLYLEKTFIPTFREFGYSAYSYDINRSGIFNFSNLKTLTKNCGQ